MGGVAATEITALERNVHQELDRVGAEEQLSAETLPPQVGKAKRV